MPPFLAVANTAADVTEGPEVTLARATTVRFGLKQRQTFQLVSYVEPESA
jgi:hypothetical protein